MNNTLRLTGAIPFPSADLAQVAHRVLDGELAATVCRNYSDCIADVLHVDVELATQKDALDIAALLARHRAIGGVIESIDPDLGLTSTDQRVAVIPIPNANRHLSLVNYALKDLRENPAFSSALSVEAIEKIEDFARQMVEAEQSARARENVTHDDGLQSDVAMSM